VARRSVLRGGDAARHQPRLSVLPAHGVGREARLARMGAEHAVPSSGASRAKRSVPGSQLRRDPDRLRSHVRDFCRGESRRAVRLRLHPGPPDWEVLRIALGPPEEQLEVTSAGARGGCNGSTARQQGRI
jgi:hypothetical protein